MDGTVGAVTTPAVVGVGVVTTPAVVGVGALSTPAVVGAARLAGQTPVIQPLDTDVNQHVRRIYGAWQSAASTYRVKYRTAVPTEVHAAMYNRDGVNIPRDQVERLHSHLMRTGFSVIS